VGQLNPVDVESLERLRKDLEFGIDSDECDWEPLERVLSLRPLFFRLLRSAVGGGGSRPKTNTIGPRTGAGTEDPSFAAWLHWLLAAQGAVLSLGSREQQRLWIYVDLCTRRRADLSRNGMMDAGDDADLFPILGGAPGGGPFAGPEPPSSNWGSRQADPTSAADFPSLGGTAVEGPGAGWGRPRQAPPPKVRTAQQRQATGWDEEDDDQHFPSLGPAGPAAAPSSGPASASWGAKAAARPAGAKASQPAPQAQPKKAKGGPPPVPSGNDFPSFGSGGGGAAPAPASSWTASRVAQPPVPARAPVQAPAPAKAKAASPAAAEFPTLGGSGGAASSSWATQARDRERSAAEAAARPAPLPAPPKKKTFEGIAEDYFPGLPSAAPAAPRQATSAAARAGAAAGAAAKAKAGYAKAAAASSQQRAAPPPDSWEEEEEEELVVIHNPLDAVAMSEAANAARKNTKATSKQGGRKGAVAVNSWAK